MRFEDATTEFKREFTSEIKKTVIAFANTNGGTIYIGLNNDGTPRGLENPDEVILQASNMIRESIRPDLTMFTSCRIEQIDGKPIVVIDVQKGTSSPYYIAGKGIRPEGVYVRQGASTAPASENTILKMIKETDGNEYEDTRSLNQDLTFDASERVFREENMAFGASQMRTLGLVNEDGLYSNLALLLSDQNPHTVKTAVFEGDKKSIFKDRYEFSGSLLKQFSEITAFIDRYNTTSSHLEGIKRIDEREYPPEAIREALLNSIVHRDYTYSDSGLISIFSNRIEFLTLGGLVKGITRNDIELGVSVLRNKKLAQIFYRLGYIEAYGTGILKIKENYSDSAIKAQIDISDNSFKITLPSLLDAKKQEVLKADGLTESESLTLTMFDKKTQVQRKEVESFLNVSNSQAGKILRTLKEKGFIRQQGQGRTTSYMLNES